MDFGLLIPNVNQIIKYPFQKVNKGDLGFFPFPSCKNPLLLLGLQLIPIGVLSDH